MKYIIVGSNEVDSYLSEGWLLYSSPFVVNETVMDSVGCQYVQTSFCQAMVLTDQPVDYSAAAQSRSGWGPEADRQLYGDTTVCQAAETRPCEEKP
jgi:hypothetical protein